MRPLFKCEINYFSSPFLAQLYDGFEKLRRKGIVDVVLKPAPGNTAKPILKVLVNDRYTFLYDTIDGLNWIEGSVQENLDYFKNNIKADFYFKRSYNQQVPENAPEHCRVFPLGLNLPFDPEGWYPKSVKETVMDLIRKNYVIARCYKKSFFSNKDFEFYPVPWKEDRIFFITRLWDPEDTSLSFSKADRVSINQNRINYIKACKREFGHRFTGGLQKNSYTIKNAGDLILPFSLTKREAFLRTIKEHNICIASSGLHHSLTWKVAEYVSASRAILSEPMHYELPGNFEMDKNYMTFSNEDELLQKIHLLLKNKETVLDMMRRNFEYYHNYLRPDMMVLNSLLKIYQYE